MGLWRICLVVGVLGGLGGAARGQQIYGNTGSASHKGCYEMSAYLLADDFSLSAPTGFDHIRFWSQEVPGTSVFAGSYRWRIHSDASGIPGAVIASGLASSITRTNPTWYADRLEYTNDFEVPAMQLAPGRYWLELHNGDTSRHVVDRFSWSMSDQPNGTAVSMRTILPDESYWAENFQNINNVRTDFQLAFELWQGAPPVPEPSAAALLAPVALALVRRARCKP